MSAQEARQPVHAAIQQSMNTNADDNVITGWVCVAESMGPDGRKWLSLMSSDASGERRLPRWTEQGLLHNGLHGDGHDGWDLGEDADD